MMPHRWTPLETGFRAYHGTGRSTINEMDDGKQMQEGDLDMMHSDSRKGVEFVQSYGMSTRVLPRDKEGGNKGGDIKGPAAEAHMSYVGGNKSHPVITAMDDRRHRPTGLEAGENIQYDEQWQAMWNKRDGQYHQSPHKIALQHITKPDDQQSGAGGSLTGGGQQQQKKKKGRDLKKEVTVNAEVLVLKDRVDIKVGGKVIARFKADEITLVNRNYIGVDDIDEKPKMKVDLTDAIPTKQVFSKPSS
jgi:phage gp45-like